MFSNVYGEINSLRNALKVNKTNKSNFTEVITMVSHRNEKLKGKPKTCIHRKSRRVQSVREIRQNIEVFVSER